MRRRDVLVRTGLSGLALLLGEKYGSGQQDSTIFILKITPDSWRKYPK